jgi:hypothetical protein
MVMNYSLAKIWSIFLKFNHSVYKNENHMQIFVLNNTFKIACIY